MAQYWLSFVDPDLSDPPERQVPGGGGFLGVCIVEADGPVQAVVETHRLGINPGGEVMIAGPSPVEYSPEVMNRLLTKEETDAL